MHVHEFQTKWRNAALKERSAAQEHFIDLCRMFRGAVWVDGWSEDPAETSDDDILSRLLALNLERAAGD